MRHVRLIVCRNGPFSLPCTRSRPVPPRRPSAETGGGRPTHTPGRLSRGSEGRLFPTGIQRGEWVGCGVGVVAGSRPSPTRQTGEFGGRRETVSQGCDPGPSAPVQVTWGGRCVQGRCWVGVKGVEILPSPRLGFPRRYLGVPFLSLLLVGARVGTGLGSRVQKEDLVSPDFPRESGSVGPPVVSGVTRTGARRPRPSGSRSESNDNDCHRRTLLVLRGYCGSRAGACLVGTGLVSVRGASPHRVWTGGMEGSERAGPQGSRRGGVGVVCTVLRV